MSYHEYNYSGKIHHNGIRTAGLQELDLEAPRPETAYDHIFPDLLSELKSRWGVGASHTFLKSSPW